MFDLLKNLALDKLKEKMLPNSLGDEATHAAAEQGSSQLINSLVDKVKSGDLSTITSLFSNDGTATQDNDMFQGLVSKLTGTLQEHGMSADEAQTEASNIAPDVLDSIKEKFLSNNDEDSGFDISNLTSLLGGNAAGLIGKIKGLF